MLACATALSGKRSGSTTSETDKLLPISRTSNNQDADADVERLEKNRCFLRQLLQTESRKHNNSSEIRPGPLSNAVSASCLKVAKHLFERAKRGIRRPAWKVTPKLLKKWPKETGISANATWEPVFGKNFRLQANTLGRRPLEDVPKRPFWRFVIRQMHGTQIKRISLTVSGKQLSESGSELTECFFVSRSWIKSTFNWITRKTLVKDFKLNSTHLTNTAYILTPPLKYSNLLSKSIK